MAFRMFQTHKREILSPSTAHFLRRSSITRTYPDLISRNKLALLVTMTSRSQFIFIPLFFAISAHVQGFRFECHSFKMNFATVGVALHDPYGYSSSTHAQLVFSWSWNTRSFMIIIFFQTLEQLMQDSILNENLNYR